MLTSKRTLISGLLLAALVGAPAHAAQYARPDADLTPGGWTAVPSGSLFEAVNESAQDDGDYIDSGNGNNTTVVLRLSDILDPGVDTGHILRFTCQSAGAKKGEICDGALWEVSTQNPGGLQIASTTNNAATRGAFNVVTLPITDIEAAAITDYTGLEVRITPSDLDVDESIQVSWIELEVPDAAVAAPTVTSPTFASVTDTAATLGGTMTSENGDPVTECGVEWGTSPGTYPNQVPDLPGDQPCQVDVPFTVDVTGLPADTLIYFRAYATNGQGPGYAESTFTTDGPPIVTSPTFAGVGDTFATLGGTLTSENGDSVTECGVEWGTSPGTYPNQVPDLPGDQPCQVDVPFTVDVTGLPAGAPVYFRAYATNAVGTGYAESSFSTNGPPTVTSLTSADVTDTTATLGGTLTNENGSSVTECGVEWGTTAGSYPNQVPDLPGDQPCQVDVPFTVDVTGLPSGTLMYIRAYATSAGGTGYVSGSAIRTLATVTSPTSADVSQTTATLGGTVSIDGTITVTNRGVEWGTASGGPYTPVADATGGTGTFTVPVTGLPADTPIFFRAYATNAGGRSYSTESSFTTQSAPEPTVQASSVVFSRISGRAFTIDWTRGNGDGSIVVLRLQATSKTDPQDGNDYTPEPDLRDPPTELPVSSGNYVVHKGPQSTVWVTGLTLDTIYSVAVYEYTNSGANTNYLLTNPAEGTQATGTVPTHNEDFRADCGKCHYHGSFSSHGDDLTAVCETCHNLSGDAADKLEFANHLTPNSNPSVDFVDCGVCHELHLGGTTLTLGTKPGASQPQVNKSFLRANVDKYISTAAPPAFLHTDDPRQDDPAQALTPDRAVEGGDDTTSRGYCQVCHTLTSYHTNNPSTSGSDQCHDGESGNCGPAETHCGRCHEHNNSFQGVGGSVSCVVCHASQQPDTNPTRPIITTQFDRLSTHVPGGSAAVTQPDCQVCHNFGSHYGQKVNVFNVDDGSTTYEQPTQLGDPLATGEGEEFEPHCLSCHGDSIAASLPDDGNGDQTKTSPFTGSDLTTTNVERIDATSWAFSAHNRPSGSFPDSPVTCIGNGANGCHASGHGSESNSLLASWDGISDPNFGTPASSAPVSPINFCYNCHDADGPSLIDVQAQFNTATNFQQTSGSGALINQRHDITTADQTYSSTPGFAVSLSCNDCHAVHVDSSLTHGAAVIDPDTATPLPNYSPTGSYTDDGYNIGYNGGGDRDPLNPEGLPSGGFTEPDYIQFCLTCHDGTTPPGVTLSENLINMADVYGGVNGETMDQHAAADGSTGTTTSKGGLKYPFVTSAQDQADSDPSSNYAAMNCSTCHGAHGTGSIFNLRESITVAGVQMTVGGGPFGTTAGATGILDDPAYFGSTTYTLPVITPRNGDPTQQDHYWGAWCTFCHKMDAHPGKTEEDSCTNGHMHGGGAF